MATRIGKKFRNSAFVRYVGKELKDPEVRSAGRDIAVLYGLHKGLRQVPKLEAKVRARFGRWQGNPDNAMDVLREAHFGRPTRVRLRPGWIRRKVGSKALRFKRRGFVGAGRAIKRGKAVLKILSVVR